MADDQSEKKEGPGTKLINFGNSQARNRVGKKVGKQVAKKLASQGVKMAAREAGVSLLAATSEFWVPALIIFLIIIVFIVVLLGGASNNNGVGPSTSPSPTPTNSILPSGSPGAYSGSILAWGKRISDAVTPALSCSNTRYNRQRMYISNQAGYTAQFREGTCSGLGAQTYFCSDLVVDAYNFAGIRNHMSVYTPTMISQWQSQVGQPIRKSNNVVGIQPGDAVFWLVDPTDRMSTHHVDIVYKINVSSNGNGTLTTMDTNTNSKFNTFTVVGWSLDPLSGGTKWTSGANHAWFGLAPR